MPMKRPLARIWKGERAALFTCVTTEISAQCNRTCVFCPNHDFERPAHEMPLRLIEKAVDELAALKFKGRWQPYMYNEPLKDKRLLSIVEMVRRACPRTVINISTNCDYLTEDYLDALIAAGVNQLACNIYSARDGSTDAAKVAYGIEASKQRAAVVQRWLDKRPHINQNASLYMGGSPRRVVARVLHKYGVQQNGEGFGGDYKLTNRAGNLAFLKPARGAAYQGTCTRPFRTLEVRWTGDAVLCCQDYLARHTFGNLKTHTLEEMWNHQRLHQFRTELQDGIRTGICAKCDYNGGTFKHMITRVELTRRTRGAHNA